MILTPVQQYQVSLGLIHSESILQIKQPYSFLFYKDHLVKSFYSIKFGLPNTKCIDDHYITNFMAF